MRKKSQPHLVPKRAAPLNVVVKEEITKAAQTAQLLRADPSAAYKAAADPLLQMALQRIMKVSADLQAELVQVETAMQCRT
jgi:hypothetical protein